MVNTFPIIFIVKNTLTTRWDGANVLL
jgi:hypothetical protein